MKKTVFALVLLLSVGIAPVFACTPTATPSPIPNSNATASPMSLEERALTASMIFVGTVVDKLCPELCEVEIEIEEYLKGEGAEVVWVGGFGFGTDCHPIVEVGYRRIFFVETNPSGILQVINFQAGIGATTPDATPENIARIVAMTNQSIVPEQMPIDTQIIRIGNRYAWLIGTSLIIIIGISLFLFWRRSGRKPKAKRDS